MANLNITVTLEEMLRHLTDSPARIDALTRVIAERERQIEVERWSEVLDDHARKGGELAYAAAAYALSGAGLSTDAQALWPFDTQSFKPKPDARRDLERAGALILAELERLHRKASSAAAAAADAAIAAPSDAELGMAWFNGLTATERLEWLNRANTCVAAEAWEAYKKAQT